MKELEWIKDLELTNVVVEMNSEVFIKLIQEKNPVQPLWAMIWDCCILLDVCSAKIIHTKREGNKCANMLARLGADQADLFVILTTPPGSITMPLMADCARTSFLRGS